MCFQIISFFQVFHQGDIGTHWYAVITGTLDVCLINPDSPEEVSMFTYTVYVVYLAVTLIWWFGEFLLVRQI